MRFDMRNTDTPPVHNFYMIAKTMLKFKNYFLMLSLFTELQTLNKSYALQKLNHCFQQRTSVYPLLIFVLLSYYALHHSVTDIVVLPMWSHANSPLITYNFTGLEIGSRREIFVSFRLI